MTTHYPHTTIRRLKVRKRLCVRKRRTTVNLGNPKHYRSTVLLACSVLSPPFQCSVGLVSWLSSVLLALSGGLVRWPCLLALSVWTLRLRPEHYCNAFACCCIAVDAFAAARELSVRSSHRRNTAWHTIGHYDDNNPAGKNNC